MKVKRFGVSLEEDLLKSESYRTAQQIFNMTIMI